MEQLASPNHSSRSGHAVSVLVIHATAGSFDSALDWLRSPDAKVSAHYLISRLGRVVQLVPEELEAWHAGTSQWRGLEVWRTIGGRLVPTLNPVSIGIELENLNTGSDPYPTTQLVAAAQLARSIIARHGVLPDNLVRHCDIAIPRGRKSDPAGFPWQAWRAQVLVTEAGHERMRARFGNTYVRKVAAPAGGLLGTLAKNELVTVAGVVEGQLVVNALGVSDRWARLASGGYVWLPQLEAA